MFREILHARRAGDDNAAAIPQLSLSLSIGVAIADPGQEPLDVMRTADERLYEAKRSGRNRVSRAIRP